MYYCYYCYYYYYDYLPTYLYSTICSIILFLPHPEVLF
jgi:hypothetical protein